jgi:predicted dinucleotide-binding enzyme
MRISVLGTGMVGQIIAGKMDELGHQVFMGTRDAEATKARTKPNQMTGISFADWHKGHPNVQVIDYGILPPDTDLYINATNGNGSLDALRAVGSGKLEGKVILDIANPLDFSAGFPPSLTICNTDSLGEQIQREFPDSKVVKSLNTMNAYLMVEPSRVPGDHSVIMSGNDAGAKDEVRNLLKSMGWKDSTIIDLGDITTARGTEMMLPVWTRLYSALGTPYFNFHINKK